MRDKQNLHTHTTYADGKDTPEQIILEAIDKGFDSIGFSEHSYMYFSSSSKQMSVAAVEDYKKEVHLLKEKYADKISVFCGMEFELYSKVQLSGFDYIIGSAHYLKLNGEILGFDKKADEMLAYVNDNFAGDWLAFSKKYYETLSTLPEKGKFDIVGHFDLVSKHNENCRFFDESNKDYLYAGYAAIEALKGKIPLFEVNTGSVGRGYKSTPYPNLAFIKEFKRQGFGAVISSDCHDKKYLDCYFSEAEKLLAAAGYKTKWILTENGFKEIEL